MSTEPQFDFTFCAEIDDNLPKSLESMVDNAIKQDFTEIMPITADDRKNDMYKAMRFALDCAHVKILFERKCITIGKEPVIPKIQFMFGFKPMDGLCIFTQKKAHKTVLCDNAARDFAKGCFLTQSLQYILVESEAFRVWRYIPVCCSNDTCALKKRPLEIRANLFEP